MVHSRAYATGRHQRLRHDRQARRGRGPATARHGSTGVAKTRPNFEAETAIDKGFPLYAAVEERAELFAEAGLEIAGPVEDLVAEADVVVDATPSGIGAQNKALYEEYDTPALYQAARTPTSST